MTVGDSKTNFHREAAEEAVVAGRLAGSRLAVGRLALDRQGRLYDLFADIVSEAFETVFK